MSILPLAPAAQPPPLNSENFVLLSTTNPILTEAILESFTLIACHLASRDICRLLETCKPISRLRQRIEKRLENELYQEIDCISLCTTTHFNSQVKLQSSTPYRILVGKLNLKNIIKVKLEFEKNLLQLFFSLDNKEITLLEKIPLTHLKDKMLKALEIDKKFREAIKNQDDWGKACEGLMTQKKISRAIRIIKKILADPGSDIATRNSICERMMYLTDDETVLALTASVTFKYRAILLSAQYNGTTDDMQ